MPRRRSLASALRSLGLLPAEMPAPVRPSTEAPTAACSYCGRTVKITTRGTLYRHRVTPDVARYCDGSGPRAPRRESRWPRPDLAFPNLESARYLLEQLEQQDKRK
jgi:hypothetical protein